MTLSAKQAVFTEMYHLLISYAYFRGYRVRYDFLKRCPDCKVGNKNSLHKERLAGDLLVEIHINNRWVWQKTDKSGCYTALGEFWEYLGGSWGGRFKNKDYNHFSLAHAGRK